MAEANRFAYIAVNPGCGCVTAITMEGFQSPLDLAKDVADFIASGRHVERVEFTEEVRARFGKCEHEKPWRRDTEHDLRRASNNECRDCLITELEVQALEGKLRDAEHETAYWQERCDELAAALADAERGIVDLVEVRRLAERLAA